MFSGFAGFLSALAAFSMIAAAAGGAGDGVAVYSNEDIEKYKYPSDSRTPQSDTRKERRKEEVRKNGDRQDKEYWCARATQYRKKLEKAQKEAERLEARLEELKGSASQELGKKRKALEKNMKETRKKLKTAQKQVKDRQRDMDRIEDDAHSKGVPPGWLRCQLTW